MPKTLKRKRKVGHSLEEIGEEKNHRNKKSPSARRRKKKEEVPFDWDDATIPVEEEGGRGKEDEEKGMSEGREGEVEAAMPPAAKKPKRSGLYHPPTHEELHTLKETQNLFTSNLMKLQVSLEYTGLTKKAGIKYTRDELYVINFATSNFW